MAAAGRDQEAPPDRLPAGPSAYGFFLDVDGTRVDIAETPDLVRAEPALLVSIGALHAAAGGAVALISGRSVAGVDRLFAPLRLPVAGQHGAERRDAAGAVHTHAHSETELAQLRRCIADWAAGVAGLLIEDKGMSLAIHYRRAPQLEEEVYRVLRDCLARAGDAFRLQSGRMVLEVKPTGRDKGAAIADFMAEPPFAGRIPVFLGDDVTDEDGFAVVSHMGGHAIKIGAGPSLAGWRLPDVAAARRWLQAILDGAAP